jgi:hypothetical protein
MIKINKFKLSFILIYNSKVYLNITITFYYSIIQQIKFLQKF